MSNIPPPAALPSFVLQQQPVKEAEADASSKFSPAIPADKNITAEPPTKQKQEPEPKEEEGDEENELPSMQDIAHALSPITDGVKNSVVRVTHQPLNLN